MTVTLTTEATDTGPALLLRPWRPSDAPALAAAHRDPVLRQWLTTVVCDEAEALRLIDKQTAGWDEGLRFSFAVLAPTGLAGAPGDLVGGAVVKMSSDFSPAAAEVGYWTAAAARGQGIAPRALETMSRWAFASHPAVERLELLHEVGNLASCRVAGKCGYAFHSELPPRPPAFPTPGHLHIRTPDAAEAPGPATEPSG